MTRFLLLLAFCLGICGPQGHARDSLRLRLDSAIVRHLPSGAAVGVAVHDLTQDTTLYLYNADKLCRPASVMKLLTAVTALSMPRASEPFTTEVWAKGIIRGDTLHGDLYVLGGFDPEFSLEDLDSLVSTLASTGIRAIDGRLWGDVSAKDSLYWGAGWLWDDNPSAFQPYLSPLMLERGAVRVVARPGAHPGDPALLHCVPAPGYFTLTNKTTSRQPRKGSFRLTRDWMDNGNHLIATGNVSSPQALTLNVYRSEGLFMHALARRLYDRGLLPDTTYGFCPLQPDSTARRLALHATPVQTVLNQMMKESDNLCAEAMLWRIGRQSTGHDHISAKDGLRCVKSLLTDLGVDSRSYRLADGCGLSHYDYLTPRLLVEVLRHAYRHSSVFGPLYKALPVSGTDGTLKHRLGRGTPAYRRIFAKTGSYTGINCLAGYALNRQGHWLAFSIMVQNSLSGRDARILQDSICLELMEGD